MTQKELKEIKKLLKSYQDKTDKKIKNLEEKMNVKVETKQEPFQLKIQKGNKVWAFNLV